MEDLAQVMCVLSTHARQLRFTYHDDVPVVDDCQLKQRDCTSERKKYRQFIQLNLL